MKKPKPRPDIPPRSNENRKRRLFDIMSAEQSTTFFAGMKYEGSPKHKQNPHLFGLEPFRGERGDRTLCDAHARFNPDDFARLSRLQECARAASLIGNFIWTVDDNGWIYELAVTNAGQNQYHGYPVWPSEAIAEKVFIRFRHWAALYGSAQDKAAAQACQSFYGFRS
jgi:hypothetical protein